MFPNTRTYPTLYKRGVKGEVRCWRMELTYGGDTEAAHRAVSGIQDGAETPSGWSHPSPKNVGKKNATTHLTQAMAEIEAEYTKKLDRGYFEAPEDIDSFEKTKPMLAQDWAKRKAKVKIEDGVWAQPKLDGIRCIARADGLWTRTGKPIHAVPHVWDALVPLFEADPEAVFDGELYAHHLREDFNRITSAVRKQKPSAEDIEAAVEIEYHIYDMPSHGGIFSERMKALAGLLIGRNDCTLQFVETVWVTDAEMLDTLYGRWLEEGYEGQMVRLDEEYQFKRSNFLMKRKEFVTMEFKVRAVCEGEGNWRGYVKRFEIGLTEQDAPEYVATYGLPKKDDWCGTGVRGTQAVLKELLESGKTPDWATVRFFTPTPDGYPRFPVVVDWGWGVRAD